MNQCTPFDASAQEWRGRNGFPFPFVGLDSTTRERKEIVFSPQLGGPGRIRTGTARFLRAPSLPIGTYGTAKTVAARIGKVFFVCCRYTRPGYEPRPQELNLVHALDMSVTLPGHLRHGIGPARCEDVFSVLPLDDGILSDPGGTRTHISLVPGE